MNASSQSATSSLQCASSIEYIVVLLLKQSLVRHKTMQIFALENELIQNKKFLLFTYGKFTFLTLLVLKAARKAMVCRGKIDFYSVKKTISVYVTINLIYFFTFVPKLSLAFIKYFLLSSVRIVRYHSENNNYGSPWE